MKLAQFQREFQVSAECSGAELERAARTSCALDRLVIEKTLGAGPVTLLSMVQGKGGNTFLLVAEGQSVPGPTLQIGNTNSRHRFQLPAQEFTNCWAEAGPAHHCAIGVGHLADRLEKLARLVGVECRRIC
jgi:L-arabinose isomerase